MNGDQFDDQEVEQSEERATLGRRAALGLIGATGLGAITSTAAAGKSGSGGRSNTGGGQVNEYGVHLTTTDADMNSAYTNEPHLEYVAEKNTTFIVFASSPPQRNPHAITYDHDADEFSSPVRIGANPLPADDSHGPPSISIDDDGIIHTFFGSHGQDIQYGRSVEPYDISSWETRGLSEVPGGTYYSTAVANNNVYAFYRKGSGAPHEMGIIIESTDGGDTFTAQTIIDQASGGNDHDDVYANDLDSYKGRLYFSWVTALSDDHGRPRMNPRIGYFDPDSRTVHTMDGTSYGDTITWDERPAFLLHEGGEILVLSLTFDDVSDAAYVAFAEETDAEGVYEYKLASYHGVSNGSGSWNTESVAGLTSTNVEFSAPRVNDRGLVEVGLVQEGAGKVLTRLRNGSWDEQTVIPKQERGEAGAIGGTLKFAMTRDGSDELIGYYADLNNNLYAVGTAFVDESISRNVKVLSGPEHQLPEPKGHRLYFALDSSEVFYDDGDNWQQLEFGSNGITELPTWEDIVPSYDEEPFETVLLNFRSGTSYGSDMAGLGYTSTGYMTLWNGWENGVALISGDGKLLVNSDGTVSSEKGGFVPPSFDVSNTHGSADGEIVYNDTGANSSPEGPWKWDGNADAWVLIGDESTTVSP